MSGRGGLVFRVALGVLFAILGTIFTFSPEALSHSPIGFETRGFVHHAFFHYPLWLGGAALLLGLYTRDRTLEIIGLVGCLVPIVLNLAGLLTGQPLADTSGFDVALRGIVISVIVARLVEIYHDKKAGR